jgi:thiol-disulfide isomerase/thioredoxin
MTISAESAPAATTTAPTPPAGANRSLKLFAIGLSLLALVALFWPRSEGTFEATGGYLLDGDGRPITVASRLAPVTLVHFWATWCAPCITEIPALKRLAADFADEPEFDLVMVAVENEATDVERFLGNLAPMALFDPSWEVAHRYGTRKLPETYLVVGGKVLETPSQRDQLESTGIPLDGDTPRWVGQTNWDDPIIREELREVLAQRRGAAG